MNTIATLLDYMHYLSCVHTGWFLKLQIDVQNLDGQNSAKRDLILGAHVKWQSMWTYQFDLIF